jgi:hypothetical protein
MDLKKLEYLHKYNIKVLTEDYNNLHFTDISVANYEISLFKNLKFKYFKDDDIQLFTEYVETENRLITYLLIKSDKPCRLKYKNINIYIINILEDSVDNLLDNGKMLRNQMLSIVQHDKNITEEVSVSDVYNLVNDLYAEVRNL